MAKVQGTSINDAWPKAIASYKRQLNSKELQTVQTLTSPEDIVKHMEQLEKDRRFSRSGKFMNRIKSITDRLGQFSKVVDIMTMSNVEASLIWGSLKLLLTIVHQFSEEYERICQSLVTVGESLQIVELLAETFSHSPIVGEYVVKYYCSILHFWRKAIKHYRRSKFVNLIRGALHDYNSEFGEFEAVMMRLRTETQEAAVAVNMNEARKARQQQDKFHTESVDKTRTIEKSRRHREIVEWLTPSTRDANYYVDDFKTACRDRHPGTCEWILGKHQFQQWFDCDGTDSQIRMLWVSATAGAGKTVLAAFIIAHCRAHIHPSAQKPLLYFFFKNTDDEKDSLLSMTRSFLHQLYVSFSTEDFVSDLMSLKEGSGKDSMLSDKRAWEMLTEHAKKMSGMTIVLDALDECKLGDIDELLNRLCLLAREFDIRVIVTSRREEKIRNQLESWPCIPIQQQDIDADIQCFVVAKVGNIARLNSGLLRDQIVRTLTSRHEGMFLWVVLMIKELKSLATVKEVEDRLLAAPRGLKDMHRAIITRLGTTLSSSERFIALKVLSWVISAIRPLRLAEIHDILRFEIQRGSENDDLLYSEKDLELLCGSLVTTRNGVLQLIHLSTKEILQDRPGGMSPEDPCWPFYVDVQEIGPRMALLCTSYIVTHQHDIDSYIRPNLTPTSRLEPCPGQFDLPQIVRAAPFIEYAYTSWQVHLVDSEVHAGVVHELQRLLSFRFTLLWLEFRLCQDPESVWKVEGNCIAMRDWVLQASTMGNVESEPPVAFLRAWCEGMLEFLKDRGIFIKHFPEELHYIDSRPFFSSRHLTGFYSTIGHQDVRELELYPELYPDLDQIERAKPKPEAESHRRLLPQPEGDGDLGFVLYDEKRDLFCYCESDVTSRVGVETLWLQDRHSGRRLPPLSRTLTPPPDGESWHRHDVIGALFSRNFRCLAVVHRVGEHYWTTIWEMEDRLDFHDIRQSQPWARRLQCLHHVMNDALVDADNPRESTDDVSPNPCCPLAIGPDECFATLHGLVDPHRGLRQGLPAYPANRKDRHFPVFSPDGRILFYSEPEIGSRKIYKVFWLDPVPTTETLYLPDWFPSTWWCKTTLRGISHGGDYLVFTKVEEGPGRATCTVYMLNTRTGAAKDLWSANVVHYNQDWFLRKVVFWNRSLILLL